MVQTYHQSQSSPDMVTTQRALMHTAGLNFWGRISGHGKIWSSLFSICLFFHLYFSLSCLSLSDILSQYLCLSVSLFICLHVFCVCLLFLSFFQFLSLSSLSLFLPCFLTFSGILSVLSLPICQVVCLSWVCLRLSFYLSFHQTLSFIYYKRHSLYVCMSVHFFLPRTLQSHLPQQQNVFLSVFFG